MSIDPQSPVQSCSIEIIADRRELIIEGVVAEIGSRAFDILELLIAARGHLVSKDEIMSRVWPDTVVEENTLQVQISALRKALKGDRGLIKTVSGRGYRLSPEFKVNIAPTASGQLPPTNLRTCVSPLIGRETELDELTDQIFAYRIVTLVGVGGIGKTRLAFEIAQRLLPSFSDGVWFVELGPLSNPDLVTATVAGSLRVSFAGGTITPIRVAQAIGAKQLLVVLDNCEHVIYRAAEIAEALTCTNPNLRVLCTSREPLRADGEHTYRLAPLSIPDLEISEPEDLLRFSSVQLFLARTGLANAALDNRQQLASAAALCRRLDGIPLAIELVAARAAMLGIDELAARVEDRFLLLTGGRRTAVPRHQTLHATIDWSYDLLSVPERQVFERLSVFAGGFALEAASHVASTDMGRDEVNECVSNLVSKSLVSADHSVTPTYFRLLEVTRAYGLATISELERNLATRRHAEYFTQRMENADTDWGACSSDQWLQKYGRSIDNIRAALGWAFSPAGDPRMGVALSAAAAPLMFELNLMEECRGWANRGLLAIKTDNVHDPLREMKLWSAFGAALIYSRGPTPETNAAWSKVLEMAARLDDAEYQARALWGLWNANIYAGLPKIGLQYAERFSQLAASTGDVAKQLLGRRIIGISLHYLGDQRAARAQLEYMLARYVQSIHRWRTVGFRVDHGIVGRATLAQILWLQGFPDQAMELVVRTVDDAVIYGHEMSTCYVLVEAAIPLSLRVKDLVTAERYLAILLAQSKRHGFVIWNACGHCFEQMLQIRKGEVAGGLPLFRMAVERLAETGFATHMTIVLGHLAEAMGAVGAVDEGLVAIKQALDRCVHNDERWSLAELLRIKGDLIALQVEPRSACEAESAFLEAIEWSRQQGALSWELKAATSLARLWQRIGRDKEANDLLGAVYRNFTEGWDTDDLKAARAVLAGAA